MIGRAGLPLVLAAGICARLRFSNPCIAPPSMSDTRSCLRVLYALATKAEGDVLVIVSAEEGVALKPVSGALVGLACDVLPCSSIRPGSLLEPPIMRSVVCLPPPHGRAG